MTWRIPAKTFLIGEYVAITGAPAMVVTTSPCFEVSLSNHPECHGIHPASPAGRWWAMRGHVQFGLTWHDPYGGRGGLGASSAQFMGAYLASHHLNNEPLDSSDLFDAYLKCAWQGEGMPPSGYDLIAQSLSGCVYIDKQQSAYQVFSWPFKDVAFLLLHTGQKLATHDHLKTMSFSEPKTDLIALVQQAKNAFDTADAQGFINAINAYHAALTSMNLVAKHSQQYIASFKTNNDVLAVKGCGAMGADVLLLLVPQEKKERVQHQLSMEGWSVMATSADIYNGRALMPLSSTVCPR